MRVRGTVIKWKRDFYGCPRDFFLAFFVFACTVSSAKGHHHWRGICPILRSCWIAVVVMISTSGLVSY